MRLSTKTRYGVRAVFDIAFHSAGGPTQAKDIARREEIPLRYLEQIFQDLRRAGVVDSRRGPRGGYYLRRPAEEIKLGDLIRALQGPIELLFSPEERPKKRRDDVPSSRQVTGWLWRALADHVTGWFDSIVIADLVKKGTELGVPRSDRRAPMYFI